MIKLLQTYKVYYPDTYGGIPYIIEKIIKTKPSNLAHEILVCGKKNLYEKDIDFEIRRVKSIANIWSMPLSLKYIQLLIGRMNIVDVTIYHAPFPIVDLVILLRFMKSDKVIIWWHSDIVTQRKIRWLIRPLQFYSLKKAKVIICLLYTSPSPRDRTRSRMPSSA